MTTAQLHPALRGDIEKLKTIDAIVLMSCAVFMLLVPDLVIRWLGLDGASLAGLRAIGVVWMALGGGLALSARRSLPQSACAAIAVAQASLAVFLLIAPFLFGVQVSARGWFLIGLLFLFLATSGMAWFFVRDRVVDATVRAARQRPAAPPDSASRSA